MRPASPRIKRRRRRPVDAAAARRGARRRKRRFRRGPRRNSHAHPAGRHDHADADADGAQDQSHWAAIPGFLDAEIAAGKSRSVRTRIKSAATTLLDSIGVAPENAPLDVSWFDKHFPVGGWDPTQISVSQPTYQDYRNRVRPVIARMRN